MSERSLFSRILRAFGRLLRRLTIATGALILILYFSGDWILDAWPTPACAEWPKSSLANARGDVAEITVHGCLLGIVKRQYLLRVRPAGDVSGKLLVRFKPKDSPALYWLDDDRLQVDLGRVSAISPQIEKAGPVQVTFTYNGADPSLD